MFCFDSLFHLLLYEAKNAIYVRLAGYFTTRAWIYILNVYIFFPYGCIFESDLVLILYLKIPNFNGP